MLSEEQKSANKIKLLEIMSKCNFDMTDILQYMDRNNYWEKPESTQYVMSYAGGLCEYTIKLYDALSTLANTYCPGKYTEQDIAKVACFKDFYKMVMYEPTFKNVQVDGNWQSVPSFKTVEGQFRPTYGDLGTSSFMLARHFVELTDEQALAIMHSKPNDTYTPDIHEMLGCYKLITLTRMADEVVRFLQEN